MVMYVIMQVILNPPKGVKELAATGVRFGFYSLLAGGLAAVVLLPEIYALQATASGDFDFPKTISCYFSIFDMIARHIGNVGTEIGLDHWPNIYCGVAVLMFLLLYLGAKKITVREKAVYCGLLLMFYAAPSFDTKTSLVPSTLQRSFWTTAGLPESNSQLPSTSPGSINATGSVYLFS